MARMAPTRPIEAQAEGLGTGGGQTKANLRQNAGLRALALLFSFEGPLQACRQNAIASNGFEARLLATAGAACLFEETAHGIEKACSHSS
mmetsp:Transcript_15316/g.35931  ORF Transcript_15316/g.35931 Transcript_15316/m.35931 type:complete len:90 (+) Transcript_15316:1060-1329(+)